MAGVASLTLAVIGDTGQGKSEFLNAYLEREAFGVYDGYESGTSTTASKDASVEGETRRGIDTPGLEDSRGDDQGHVNQMVDFFRRLKGGVNVFAIVFNGQEPRFSQPRQKLIKIIHQGFGNIPTFWDHVCLVFTRCSRKMRDGQGVKNPAFRESVIREIRQGQGEHATEIALPAFFVDSPEWNNPKHAETRLEMKRLHEFVRGRGALPTEAVVTPNVDYLKIKPQFDEPVETEVIHLLHEPDDVEWEDREQVKRFQRRVREKRTGFDGVTVTYSNWIVIRSWEERKRSSVRKEFQLRVAVGDPRIVPLPHGPDDTAYADREWIQDYKDQVRECRTDFDGVTVTYSDWTTTRTYDEGKLSFIKNESRRINRKALHVGDKIPVGAEVAIGFASSVVVGVGGVVIGIAVGTALGAAGTGAAVGATSLAWAGPVGGLVGAGAGALVGLGAFGVGKLIASRTQVGWEDTWQDFELVTNFGETDPSSERKVGTEYIKIEKC